MNKLPLVAIIGKPNVGKSTLFNRILGKRVALEYAEAGTTRDRLYAEIEWQDKAFLIVDTAGIALEEKSQPLFEEINNQIQIAAQESDLVVFLIDGKTELTTEDLTAIDMIRKLNKKVILAVNKTQHIAPEKLGEYYALGLGDPVAVEAITGKGVGDLLDLIASGIKKIKQAVKSEVNYPKIAIVGRPNVGKSSILNSICGEQRAIVSDLPGTTRDILDTQIKYLDSTYCFLDTAGMRKKARVKYGLESLSVIRSLKAISEADITMLVLSAEDEVSAQDLAIAGFAKEEGKGLIIIINKTDLREDEKFKNEKIIELHRRFAFIPYSPVIFLSAKTGLNLKYLFEIIDNIWESLNKKISTPDLNVFFQKLNLTGKLPSKVFYATQVGVKPPSFRLFVKNPKDFHFSHLRFIDKEIHIKYEYFGVPIQIYFSKKN